MERVLVLLAALLCAAGAQARPAPDDRARREASRKAVLEDEAFGPEVEIESIAVEGNGWTSEDLIRRQLLVGPGDRLRAGDPRFALSRIRVLSLGWFVDANLRLDKGSERGKVILVVSVVERGTTTLNSLFWGTSEATPLWLGIDIGNANFLGTGVALSAAVLWARPAQIPGADAQLGLRLRYGDQSLLGGPISTHASFLYNRASEPYRITGEPDDGAPEHFNAFSYDRVGGIAGIGFDITRLSRVLVDLRFEAVTAHAPPADYGIHEGRSRVATPTLGYERDTRPDPIIPYSGYRWAAALEGGAAFTGSSYDYLRARGQMGHWFPLSADRLHVFSLHSEGGIVLGDAPFFDEFFIGDLSTLITPRSLDLVLSTQPSRDVFGTTINRHRYGDVAATLRAEYSFRLFSGKKTLYAGVLYVGGGAFFLGRLDGTSGFPVDLMIDGGLRLDTEIGVFELGFANGIGRVPL